MIKIIGVAHVSEESVREVEETIETLKPDVVAVELCETRYRGLLENERKIPVFDLIKKGESTTLLVNILLSYFQKKIGRELGTKPGKEMLAAIEAAKRVNAEVALIDRDIKITLKRALAKMGFLEKIKILFDLFASMGISREEIEKELKKIKSEDYIAKLLQELKNISPNVYKVIVDERDMFMAYRLLELSRKYEKIVAVVGAGHKAGIEFYLNNPDKINEKKIKEIVEVPKRKITFTKMIKYGFPLAILAIFILAFIKGVDMKTPMKYWIINNFVPTFIAVVAARGHIFSALAGALSSPITSLLPFIGAGWVAGAVELKVGKATVEDVVKVFNVESFKELYSNKAFRVVLVTALGNLGSLIGTLISIPTVILPLIKALGG